MGRNLENYVPVNVRVMEARTENGKELTISTSVTLVAGDGGAAAGALVKAEILIGGKLIATGHSLATDLSEEKSLEKAETVAVGRALALAGYAADSAIASAEEMEDFEESTPAATPVTPPTSGFGSKRTSGFGRRS